MLSWIQGVKIDFTDAITQLCSPTPIAFSDNDQQLIQLEVNKLEAKGVIEKTLPSSGQFISNIFYRTKKDGSCRLILNLRKLNEAVEYHHFKMDTLTTAVSLMKPSCYMASVDLKYAYYSIPVDSSHRKYLRFYWGGHPYQFPCLPNGLAEAPRKFTKLMKIPFSHLRKEGFINSAYIDDSYLQGDTYEECARNVKCTVRLMDSLGFTIHPSKSVLEPSQTIVFLGFILNSSSMSVSLTSEKADKIKHKCEEFLSKRRCTIRQLAEVVGFLVAVEPGVDLAPVYYRRLDLEKAANLRTHKGSFDCNMVLSPNARHDLRWWIENVHTSCKHLLHPDFSILLRSDSSGDGWGGVCVDSTTGGPWSAEEKSWHINRKELFAAFLTLKSFCKHACHTHIRLEIDNTTAVAYINNQGGRKCELNNIARQMWLWAKERNLWLSAAHLPGSLNSVADRESRRVYATETEWQLDPAVFDKLQRTVAQCEIDLFASRLNCQLSRYVAWHPDPDAEAIDAFTVSWTHLNAFVFPSFSILQKVLVKVIANRADITLIAPMWPTQPWFSVLTSMITQQPLVLPYSPRLVTSPTNRERLHPLHSRLALTAFRISGDTCKVEAFLKTQLPSSCLRGAAALATSTTLTSTDGFAFVTKGKLIQCSHLSLNL